MKEPASSGDLLEYNICEECNKEVLSRRCEDSNSCMNNFSQPKLRFISPYDKLWIVKLIGSYFRIFEYVCYVFVPS